MRIVPIQRDRSLADSSSFYLTASFTTKQSMREYVTKSSARARERMNERSQRFTLIFRSFFFLHDSPNKLFNSRFHIGMRLIFHPRLYFSKAALARAPLRARRSCVRRQRRRARRLCRCHRRPRPDRRECPCRRSSAPLSPLTNRGISSGI